MAWLGLGYGLGLGFDTADRGLGLYSRRRVRVTVRVSSNRQGTLVVPKSLRAQPEMEVTCARGGRPW